MPLGEGETARREGGNGVWSHWGPYGRVRHIAPPSHHSVQALLRRGQIKALVDVHGSVAGFGGTLTEEETHIIKGALDLTQKTAMKSMTPLDKV